MKAPVPRTKNLITQESGDELLIYNLETSKAFCFNKTSAAVWRLCDGKRTTEEIAKHLSKIFKRSITSELVRLAIVEMHDQNLIVNGDNLGVDLTKHSRRELIKRVGSTAIIALPIVSAITAPKPTQAQSDVCMVGRCIPTGTANRDFCNGCRPQQRVALQRYLSTDGSCTNEDNISFVVTCPHEVPFFTTQDFQITSVS